LGKKLDLIFWWNKALVFFNCWYHVYYACNITIAIFLALEAITVSAECLLSGCQCWIQYT